MGITLGLLITAFLGALNVYFAVETGSAISWAAAYFMTACCALELVSYWKLP